MITKLKTQAAFFLDEIKAGTIDGSIDCNPTAATEFFGALPVLRRDRNELLAIAGAAWQSAATDAELDNIIESEMGMFGSQTHDERRAAMAQSYAGGKQGQMQTAYHGDGQSK